MFGQICYQHTQPNMENSEHIIKSIENDYESWLNYEPQLPINTFNRNYIMASICIMNNSINRLQANINTLMCIMMMNNMN